MNSERNLQSIEKRALRVNEASALYGISRSTIYLLIARGVLRSVKLGGARLIPVDALEALLSGASK